MPASAVLAYPEVFNSFATAWCAAPIRKFGSKKSWVSIEVNDYTLVTLAKSKSK